MNNILLIALGLTAATPVPGAPERPGAVRVALVGHAGQAPIECFGAGFLDLLAFETTIEVDRTLAIVELHDDRLFEFPFVIMTGEGGFTLNDRERTNMRRHVLSGGTLVASAGCSNALWAGSMREELARVFPEAPLERIAPGHEVFGMVFEVADLVTTRGKPGEVWGIEVGGRLAVVFSPQGLNDSAGAVGGCCCCGGDEIRQARFLNANLVVYSLTR